MDWRDSLDMSTIPDEVLWREVARRRSAARKRHSGGSGRPPILRACPHCGARMPATELRRVHRCDQMLAARGA